MVVLENRSLLTCKVVLTISRNLLILRRAFPSLITENY